MNLHTAQDSSTKIQPVSFWIIYTALATWIQSALPGLDPFAPALVLCLSSEKKHRSCWLITLWILLTDGSGGFAFGTMLLGYIGLAVFYFWLIKNLNTLNIIFLITLSISYGIFYYLIRISMASLQDLICSPQTILYSALINTLAFPCILILLAKSKDRWVVQDV